MEDRLLWEQSINLSSKPYVSPDERYWAIPGVVFDGERWIGNEGRTSINNVADFKTVATIPSSGQTLAFDPVARLIYICGSRENWLSCYRPDGAVARRVETETRSFVEDSILVAPEGRKLVIVGERVNYVELPAE